MNKVTRTLMTGLLMSATYAGIKGALAPHHSAPSGGAQPTPAAFGSTPLAQDSATQSPPAAVIVVPDALRHCLADQDAVQSALASVEQSNQYAPDLQSAAGAMRADCLAAHDAVAGMGLQAEAADSARAALHNMAWEATMIARANEDLELQELPAAGAAFEQAASFASNAADQMASVQSYLGS